MENKKLTVPWSDAVRGLGDPTEILGEPLLATDKLERALWPNGPVCFHCHKRGGAKIMGGAETSTRRTWICGKCSKTYSVRHGTWLYRGRMALDRVVFAMATLETYGEAVAIQKLVEDAGVRPEIADKLVRDIEDNCCGEAAPVVAPETRSKLAQRLPWLAASAAAVVASVALLWPSSGSGFPVRHGAIVDRWSYDLEGRPMQAIIETPRDGFDSIRDWAEAHSVAVRAARALMPPIR